MFLLVADFGRLMVLAIWWTQAHRVTTLLSAGVFLSLVPCSAPGSPVHGRETVQLEEWLCGTPETPSSIPSTM